MNLKIIKAHITKSDGTVIIKPNNKVIEQSELEDYRKSLKESENDKVLFAFEEIGNEKD